MKKLWQEFLAYVYVHGYQVGFALVLAPIFRDLVWSGAREWNKVSIGTVGVVSILIGAYLIWVGGKNAK